jgi:hypothetical protein
MQNMNQGKINESLSPRFSHRKRRIAEGGEIAAGALDAARA